MTHMVIGVLASSVVQKQTHAVQFAFLSCADQRSGSILQT